jgi:hypothetical protein
MVDLMKFPENGSLWYHADLFSSSLILLVSCAKLEGPDLGGAPADCEDTNAVSSHDHGERRGNVLQVGNALASPPSQS